MEAIASELAIILLLLFANGSFAGAELALLSVRKTRLQELLDQGSGAALAVKALRDNPERSPPTLSSANSAHTFQGTPRV